MALIEKTLAQAPVGGAPAWLDPATGVLERVARQITLSGVHPSRVVVLVPYKQLLPLANRYWALRWPNGFAPRFETTQSWAWAFGDGASTPLTEGDDFRFDTALDSLTARSLLERAGLGPAQDELMPRLLQASQPLALRAAAVHPADRAAWAEQASQALDAASTAMANPQTLRLESAITRIALAWASTSSYATDMLWRDPADLRSPLAAVDALIVLDGLQADPLAQALAAYLQDGRGAAKAGVTAHVPLAVPVGAGQITCHAAQDFEQEALWAAACVLRRVHDAHEAQDAASTAPVSPVALVATDRILTRRIRAMLETRGVTVRDETGWTLSTTRAAATLMTVLQASTWNASSDAVLDALKNAPVFAEAQVNQLEQLLRQARCSQWRDRDLGAVKPDTEEGAALLALEQAVQPWLERLQAPRPLLQWLADLVAQLQAGGLWDPLQANLAGQSVVAALHLGDAAQQALAPWPLSGRRLRLDEFTAWVRHTLEASNFMPPSVTQPQVVILPMSQMLARPFAAAVIPACDEVRLSPSPELPGSWTTAERVALGLPTREQAEASQRLAWQQALQSPQVDLLWRLSDSGGEPLLPSPFVQLLQWQGLGEAEGAGDGVSDPCDRRSITARPTTAPQPHGQALPVLRLSASAYEDLRRCPYRFFALRQLGLKEASELDGELEKRDIGDWLHEVLKDFHQAMQQPLTLPEALAPQLGALDTVAQRRLLLDHCAEQARARRKFSEGEFLPYQATWPGLRDAYLDWLAGHEASGAQFLVAETWHEMGLGQITLVGRVDRIDRTASLPPGVPADAAAAQLESLPVYVLDYKTESPTKTKERLKTPLEDTQLAFYAALLPHDQLRAAYLNVNEREGTQDFEQPDIVATRDALIDGIQDDLQRIAGGAVLAALGEGAACEFCAARGLCRKDFWEAV